MRSAPEAAYIVWILISTVGVLQALAAYNGWVGLSFFGRHPRLGYPFALLVIPASYVWFFSLANRNTPGLEGWQLFSRFALGALCGLLVALTLSSITSHAMTARQRSAPGADERGLDSLRNETYAAIVARLGGQWLKRIGRTLEGEMARE